MKRLLAALLLVLVLAPAALAGEVAVFAAASLTNAIEALRAPFERSHPGLLLAPTFAASGTLLGRMANGQPCDVFISADTATMDAAADRRRIDPKTRRIVAGNSLVLAVPAGNPAGVSGLDSLSRGGVRRIGVGNPESVPAGRYAKRTLQDKALWFALTAKLVYYPSVRHVLAALSAREIDAGFVYATDAAIAGGSVATAAVVPTSPPVAYPAAIAAAAANPTGGAAFLDYLATPEARAIFARLGFTAPEARIP
ncbi:MAG: molybdate ABC transporter substrate-binding protein [Solidesulfovibrio sp.]|uniref:molybdate ABC transporter substrate-binding protein n=1 Tax=Solidesulfovibrio sp. TaxID=2910990 RepID=UPI0031595745